MMNLLIALLLAAPQDAPPRVLPEGRTPADARLAPPKDLDGYFPFEVPATKAAWEQRAESVRRQIQVATGLWPFPERTPLNAKIFGRTERPDFTVDKVVFESVPGLYVTGLLFRPKGKTGPFPAVLSPHGHEGRLWDYGDKGVRQLIANGQERFEASGRFPQLARCATLARLGCVVFIPDMLGYADNIQISFNVAHRFAKQRPEMDAPERWGYFGVQAEGRLQGILGTQAWNALRALDFLVSLPDVDASRIGVTGSSGGGTQTLIVCALDPRPAVSFPQGMVSTSMQGGCTCENACYLRLGTGNVEFAALMAPKPTAMTAANDWTKEMMTKGFPELEKLYALMGAKGAVKCANQVLFPHNYNYVTRAMMYSWFNRPLRLGREEPILEQDFEPLTPAEVTVWDAEHPKPETGDAVEAAILKSTADASDRQLAALSPAARRETIARAYDVMVGGGVPPAGSVSREKVDKKNSGDRWLFTDLLRRDGEELPLVSLHPKGRAWNGKVVIWADGAGKAGLFSRGSEPRPEVASLLDAGFSVLAADLLYQGDFLVDGNPLREQPMVKNPRESVAFTMGYNAPLLSRRAHDLLTVVSFVVHDEHAPKETILVGTNGAGPWVAAARAQAGAAVTRALVDTKGFRFGALKSIRDPDFLPGALKYGDLPGLLTLSAPQPLWLAGEGGKVPAAVEEAYKDAGKADAVRSFGGASDEAVRKMIEALIQG